MLRLNNKIDLLLEEVLEAFHRGANFDVNIGETEYVCTKVHFKRLKLAEMDLTYSSSIEVQIQTNI
jgi:hypothetical protein